MSKTSAKIKTVASKEPARFADDDSGGGVEGRIERQPGYNGNDFDIRMSEEADGVKAANKIVDAIRKRGICLIEANAPPQLLVAACDEAQQLWEDDEFKPPLRVHDDRTMLEARIWQGALGDDEKVVWVPREGTNDGKGAVKHMKALRILAGNMADFIGGLREPLQQETGMKFDRVGQAMLSCYTGDRNYNLHLDNSAGDGEDARLPDNGMRLTAAYFLNTHWHPDEDLDCAGGMDLRLTDASSAPSSAVAAKIAPKFRIAPHADTLAIFYSERMAHQVIATRGEKKWFCLTLWSLEGAVMDQVPRKLQELKKAQEQDDSEDDGRG